MKWIKLFEEFDADMLEDAKHIMISHLGELEEVDFIGGDLQVEMSDRLRERIRVYRLLESPNVKDLKACEEHLMDETEGVFWNVSLDWYRGQVAIVGIGESIEEFLGEWLLERFSGLRKHENSVNPSAISRTHSQVFYLDKNGTGVFYHYLTNDKIDNPAFAGIYSTAHISFQKIWGFFQTVLCLEDSQIKQIIKDWLWDEFGLDLEPKMW
jgi:hypothetical protein